MMNNTYVGNNVIILGYAFIGSGVIVEDCCMIGKPSDTQIGRLEQKLKNAVSLKDYDEIVGTKTVVRKDCYIGRNSTIYSGSKLEEYVECRDYSLVGWESSIGKNSKLMYKAQVHSWVTIGENCRVGGFCCNDSRLGNNVSMFGNLLHAYREFGGGRREPAPKIQDNVTIGFGAQVIGEVVVGKNSYVASGSIVTKDVPPDTVVTLLNKHCRIDAWPGRLRKARGV